MDAWVHRPMWYDRQGNPVDTIEEWAQLRDTIEKKRVAYTEIDQYCVVSTVWIGIDMGLHWEGPPLIFETMVFGGEHDMECDRYSTEEQALRGHEEMVRLVREERNDE